MGVVRFGNTVRCLLTHPESGEDDRGDEEVDNNGIRDLARYFNGVIETLPKDDALQLCRYAYSNYLLDMVCIDYRIVDVFYQQTTITGHHPYISFDLSGNGTLQGARTRRPGWTDSDLRSCVLNRIYSFFCASIDNVIINVDTGAAIGFDPSPLHVEHQMWEDMSYRMAVECPVTVRMTRVLHYSDFDHFKALWLAVGYRKRPQLTEDLVQRLLLRRQGSSSPSNFQTRFILEP